MGFFQKYQRKLVPLADPDVPIALTHRIADEFFDAGSCDLDPSSMKIRDLLEAKEELFGGHWQSFLFHNFNKVVLSTAFVECIFAHFPAILDLTFFSFVVSFCFESEPFRLVVEKSTLDCYLLSTLAQSKKKYPSG